MPNLSREQSFGLLQLIPNPHYNSLLEARKLEKTPGVDIVAIHDLEGHRTESWTKDGNFILKDQLPKALGAHDPRIFTFGYNGYVTSTTSVAGVRDFALQLLSCLYHERIASKTTDVPIVFLGQGLGGIIAKKFLVVAQEQPAYYSQILQCVKGIAFIGTPHLGETAESLVWRKRLLTVGKVVTANRCRDDFHKMLLPGSPELLAIAQESSLRLAALKIASIYSIKPSSGVMRVDVASATLRSMPHGKDYPVDRNYDDLCRFGQHEMQAYSNNFELPIKNLVKESLRR